MQDVYDLLRRRFHIPPKRPHAYNSGFTAPVRCRSLRATCSLVTPLAEVRSASVVPSLQVRKPAAVRRSCWFGGDCSKRIGVQIKTKTSSSSDVRRCNRGPH